RTRRAERSYCFDCGATHGIDPIGRAEKHPARRQDCGKRARYSPSDLRSFQQLVRTDPPATRGTCGTRGTKVRRTAKDQDRPRRPGRISGRGRHTAYWPRGCSHRRVATMNGGYPTDTTGAKPGHAHDPPDVNWLRLKRLIIGNEQKRLARLEERLNSPEIQADEMASILPKAIARGLEKNPLGVSAALLLVIGPAIRNAISIAF